MPVAFFVDTNEVSLVQLSLTVDASEASYSATTKAADRKIVP